MLTTNSIDLDHRFRQLRQHYMSVPDTTRHNSAQVVFETYPELGFNFRMTDIQAAIGCEQLKRLPEIIDRRRELAVRYQLLLAEIPKIGLPVEPDWARSNWQSFCVRLPDGLDQRYVMQSLLDAGIATRRGIMCSHREAAYYPDHTWSCGVGPVDCECVAGACQRLRHSEVTQDRIIILPLFPQMSFGQQDEIVLALRNVLLK